MDTTPIANADDIIVNVTQLDKNSDTFESLLLELLKSHSRFQPCHYRDNELQITPESLDTMSMGQIQRLLTSSSVNYEAIQRLLKIKLERSRGPSPDVVSAVIMVFLLCNGYCRDKNDFQFHLVFFSFSFFSVFWFLC